MPVDTPEPTQTPDVESLDAAFAEVADRRAAAEVRRRADSQLWLSHHHPHQWERCIHIGERHVCRRCTWFYGLAFPVMALFLLGVSLWPTELDTLLLWALPIPATLWWIAEELGRARHDPRVLIAVTIPMAVAVGRGFAAELQDRWSWTFWGPCLVFGSIWLVAALIGRARGTGQYVEPVSS